MDNPTRQWRTAAKIAWRETRASSGRFVFVILAVAAGVGSLTGVRGFSRAFHTILQRDARGFMAADLSVRTFTVPDAVQMQADAESPLLTPGCSGNAGHGNAHHGRTARGRRAAADLGEGGRSRRLSVLRKRSSSRLLLDIRTALGPGMVAVADGVLLRLSAKIGDTIKIGGKAFQISAEITAEPDRMTGSINVGPRVMMSRESLESTGLLIPGSRAAERYLFRLPATMPLQPVKRESLRTAFKEGLIADYSEAHPLIEQGLRQSTTFLSLVSLVALVIGALGVATAIQAHLQQKMDSIAVMKCIGAKSAQVLRIYIMQTAGLGLAGSAAGIALGSLVQMILPIFLERYFHIEGMPRFDALSALQGLLVGVLTVPVVYDSTAAGHPLHPARADLSPGDGGTARGVRRMVEARRGVSNFRCADTRVRGITGGMAQ